MRAWMICIVFNLLLLSSHPVSWGENDQILETDFEDIYKTPSEFDGRKIKVVGVYNINPYPSISPYKKGVYVAPAKESILLHTTLESFSGEAKQNLKKGDCIVVTGVYLHPDSNEHFIYYGEMKDVYVVKKK